MTAPGAPIPLMVKRYACPHCRYRRSKKATVADHIGRCWHNPDAHGCLTCRHFDRGDQPDPATGYPGFDIACSKGVSLEGRPACGECQGLGQTVDKETLGVSDCGTCGGDPVDGVRPGPIVHCDQWEVA